jgi:hypothetical protein
VLDRRGLKNIIQYNNNFDHPLIIGGWDILKTFTGFPDNVDVRFAYHGYRCFGIIDWYNLQPYDQIHPFHSRSTVSSHITYFDVTLTEATVSKTKLVKYNFFTYSNFF